MGEQNLQRLVFNICESVLEFSTNSDKLVEEIRKDFGRFERHLSLACDGSIRIIETDNKFPLRIPKFAIRDIHILQSAIFTLVDKRFLQEGDKHILRIDFDKNKVLGYLKPNSEPSMFCPPRSLLKWMLIKTLEKKGIAFVHGSGVEKAGTSLFFVGPSSFGKTYTLVTFLLEGYNLITDDTIFLKNDSVIPLYLRSMVAEDMLRKFPILKQGLNDKSTYVPRSGWFIDLGNVFPRQKQKVQPSKLFYMYVWNAKETKVEKIPKKEMLARLFHVYRSEIGKTIWFDYRMDEARKSIFPNYNALIEKADCYRVYAGSNTSLFLESIQEKIQ
jgi:hypothetical protein